MSKRVLATATAMCVCSLGAVLITRAGPLDPPAGPVAPTFKTLTEVEPRTAISAGTTPGDTDSLFKIDKPGSYYLTGNITGVAGKHGIEIVASGVTIDLNGFDLAGVAGMGSFNGVCVTTNGVINITVANGSIRNWGASGIDLYSLGATSCRVERVIATGNSYLGIASGSHAQVSNCCSAGGQYGIYVAFGSSISDCSATGASVAGIDAGDGSSVNNCSAYSNPGQGFYIDLGCTVVDCTARNNTLDGIRCATGCLIRGNTCSLNGRSGGNGANILVSGTDNRIEGNNCTLADRGIDVNSGGNIIIRNSCSGNTTNWDVVAGNTILVVQGTSAGAVNGNTGGSAPGSTDPNANFTY